MKNFNGKILFLDRSDINTDEIIPAKYLTESSKAALKPYCLEDLILEGFDPKKDLADKSVVVTRANFGCGSSREHAPWALECNGINLVIAENFARIFRQNMFNCGMLAISLDAAKIDALFRDFSAGEAFLEMDLAGKKFTVTGSGKKAVFDFEIGDFDLDLVKAGGWVSYADARY
ncbi:MAG: 3-isopropylmalate dehydratase small subunit [Lentisphaeria bacterium]|nr:3-isopropylmalate dehydratase small subunit [Lentisphaeria bacterium]